MSSLRVDNIVNSAGTGAPSLSNGATFGQNTTITNIVINTTGITTFNHIRCVDSINVTGVCTANQFFGDGRYLSNVPGTTTGKSIALSIIA